MVADREPVQVEDDGVDRELGEPGAAARCAGAPRGRGAPSSGSGRLEAERLQRADRGRTRASAAGYAERLAQLATQQRPGAVRPGLLLLDARCMPTVPPRVGPLIATSRRESTSRSRSELPMQPAIRRVEVPVADRRVGRVDEREAVQLGERGDGIGHGSGRVGDDEERHLRLDRRRRPCRNAWPTVPVGLLDRLVHRARIIAGRRTRRPGESSGGAARAAPPLVVIGQPFGMTTPAVKMSSSFAVSPACGPALSTPRHTSGGFPGVPVPGQRNCVGSARVGPDRMGVVERVEPGVVAEELTRELGRRRHGRERDPLGPKFERSLEPDRLKSEYRSSRRRRTGGRSRRRRACPAC